MTARFRNRVLLAMTVLAAVWLLTASRVHVNASWSDGAWGYLALPVLGEPELGDVVLFDPPERIGASVPVPEDRARPAGRPGAGGPGADHRGRRPGARHREGPRP